MPTRNYCDKTVAYIDRHVGDEILEIEDVDNLPRRGSHVRFRDGDGKGEWVVYDVEPLPATAKFAALVYIDPVIT